MNNQEKINNEMRKVAHNHCDGSCELCLMARPQKGIDQTQFKEAINKINEWIL